jgi:hypothetical protein
MKLTTHLHLVLLSRIVELYLHRPIRVQGVIINIEISTLTQAINALESEKRKRLGSGLLYERRKEVEQGRYCI